MEIGSEPTPEQFIATMVEVFSEVRHVLRDDGLLFINLGDSYATNTGGGGPSDKQTSNAGSWTTGRVDNVKASGLTSGSLMNIPHRVAEALRADGWHWRQTIVWSKKSPMPESVVGWHWSKCRVKVQPQSNHDDGKNADHIDRRKVGFNDRYDNPEGHGAKYVACPGCPKCEPNEGWILRRGKGRCTTSHEYLFVFSKSPTYFWDSEASKEAAVGGTPGNKTHRSKTAYEAGDRHFRKAAGLTEIGAVDFRNPRSVWTLSSEPTREKHFATFPSELARRCIVAGVSAGGCCPTCGAPWAPMLTKVRIPTRPAHESKTYIDPEGSPYAQHSGSVIGNRDPERHTTQTKCLGYRQTCSCPSHEAVPCTVLDCFSGLATTGQTARHIGHNYIGIELNPEYAEMSLLRIQQPPRWFLRLQDAPKTNRIKRSKRERSLF